MKIHKWWVKGARQISLIENGGGGRMLRRTLTLQKRRRDGGDIPSQREVQAQAGWFLPGPARPGGSRGAFVRTPASECGIFPVPREQLGGISPGSAGLLCTNIFSLAGKFCGHC